MCWISPPAEDMFTDIRITVTPTEDSSVPRGANASVESWQPIVRHQLKSGEFLWIAHRERPMTDNQRQVVQAMDFSQLSLDPTGELRGLLQFADDTGAVGFIEVAVSESSG